jgi:hypothetical protein
VHLINFIILIGTTLGDMITTKGVASHSEELPQEK